MKQVYVAKGSQTIVEENLIKIEQSKSENSTIDNSSSDYGFNNPEFIKWQKEMKKRKDVVGIQHQSKSSSPSKRSSRSSKFDSKPKMNQHQNKKFLKFVKFVSAGKFDLSNFEYNKFNSRVKQISDPKVGSGSKSSAVHKRFESTRVNPNESK
ncbi:hypothetical protein QVD17_19637 [Tagetes erecta]|uniref:Uncharacterized protein n=1 Tax=Tagetes erecta TaxID=13708 RepID=A0AAD8KJT7_TARER|nr:hypothetical protein QVD17_19637 [Tagetes erecta]